MAKILVVDDDPQVRELLHDFLEARGHRVTVAGDGTHALEAIEAAPPDLVLLDLMMPGVTGMAVLRKVLQARPELPVLVLTAVNEPEVARAALDLGALDYMTKPIDLPVLDRVIRDVLPPADAGSDP